MIFGNISGICQAIGKPITKHCFIPQMKNILVFIEDSSGWKECTTKEEYDCLKTFLLTTPSEEFKNVCPNPCTEISYNIAMKKSFKMNEDHIGMATVILHYNSDYVMEMEEYLVLNLSGLIAAIGGNVGLFLGISFLQCGTSIIRGIQKFIQKII